MIYIFIFRSVKKIWGLLVTLTQDRLNNDYINIFDKLNKIKINKINWDYNSNNNNLFQIP